MNIIKLIEQINSSKTVQNESFEEQQLPEKIQNILNECTIVAKNLDIEQHRWYETSVVVYALNGEYFGIRYITNMYSESSDYDDIYFTITAFPMKQVQTVTYIKQ